MPNAGESYLRVTGQHAVALASALDAVAGISNPPRGDWADRRWRASALAAAHGLRRATKRAAKVPPPPAHLLAVDSDYRAAVAHFAAAALALERGITGRNAAALQEAARLCGLGHAKVAEADALLTTLHCEPALNEEGP